MKRLALPLILLLLTGCGAQGLVSPTPRTAGQAGAKSLAGDLAKKLAPIAARKGVQAALLLALKKDDKSAAAYAALPADTTEEAREDAAESRLKLLQRAMLAADVALGQLDGVEGASAAVKAAKAVDKAQSQAYSALKAGRDRLEAHVAWADALHQALAEAEDAF